MLKNDVKLLNAITTAFFECNIICNLEDYKEDLESELEDLPAEGDAEYDKREHNELVKDCRHIQNLLQCDNLSILDTVNVCEIISILCENKLDLDDIQNDLWSSLKTYIDDRTEDDQAKIKDLIFKLIEHADIQDYESYDKVIEELACFDNAEPEILL